MGLGASLIPCGACIILSLTEELGLEMVMCLDGEFGLFGQSAT